MTKNDHHSPAERKRLEEFRQRFLEELAKRPTIPDEEFMAETEVSDDQYVMGLVIPGIGDRKGVKGG